MPVEAKPLFRPDVLRPHLSAFPLPAIDRAKLEHWALEISWGRLDRFGEQEILPHFLADFFVGLLGYSGPAGRERYTLGYECHVVVDGKYADAVLGDFNGQQRYVVALEGKGPRDPLDRPFAGRRMSAVDQGYRYAINLPCDWIIVTSMRQTRLYHKGSNQQTYERFDTEQLADDEAALDVQSVKWTCPEHVSFSPPCSLARSPDVVGPVAFEETATDSCIDRRLERPLNVFARSAVSQVPCAGHHSVVSREPSVSHSGH
jgi:hypothetical protein